MPDVAPRIDWDAVAEEATQLLADFIRIDTSNPPGRELAACGKTPRALHEHPHSESERFGIAQRLHAVLARLNGLTAILADAHIRVFSAGGLRGVERAHRELLERRIGERR